MYEETVEKIARLMAGDNEDEQHWGVYATRAMEIIDAVDDGRLRTASYYEHRRVVMDPTYLPRVIPSPQTIPTKGS